MVGAHFDHGVAMPFLDTREHQRHADVVIEVAVCRQCRRLAAETSSNQFLERRLAVAPRDAHDGHVMFMAPGCAESTEGRLDVINLDLRNCITRTPRNDGPGRAVFFRNAHIVAAIEVRTVQREKQFVPGDRASVGADALERTVVALQRAPHVPGRRAERRNHQTPPLVARAFSAIA